MFEIIITQSFVFCKVFFQANLPFNIFIIFLLFIIALNQTVLAAITKSQTEYLPCFYRLEIITSLPGNT